MTSEQIPLPMNDLGAAVERLGRAVDRLEGVIGDRAVGAAGAERMRVLETRAAELTAVNEAVARQLDETIARLRALLGE